MKNDSSEDVEDFLKACLKTAHEVEKAEVLMKSNLAQCQEKLSLIEKNRQAIVNIFNGAKAADKCTERSNIFLEIDMCFSKLEIIDLLKKSKGIVGKKTYKDALKIIKPFDANEWPKEPRDFFRFLDAQEQEQKNIRKILIRSFLETFEDTNQFCKDFQSILELFKGTKSHFNKFREHYLVVCDELERIAELSISELEDKDINKKLLAYSREYIRYQRFLEGFDEIIEKTIEYELKLYWKFFELFHGYVDEALVHSSIHTVQFNVARNRNTAMSNAQNAPVMGSEKRCLGKKQA